VPYVILEARDRIGGRIYTSPGPVELGAEFVHGKPPVLCDLLERAQVRTVTVDGGQRCYENGRLKECEDTAEEASETLLKQPIASDMPFLGVPLFKPAEPDRAKACGRILFRVPDAYHAVPAFLSHGLNVRLSTPVRRIRWREGNVEVRVNGGTCTRRKPL
jgi:hypothetical protein